METIILLILVTILIFVIKNNSDISLIKAQNELNHLNLERLRKRLENFEIKGKQKSKMSSIQIRRPKNALT